MITKNTYIIVYDNYDSIKKEYREKDRIFAATAFSTWDLVKAAMTKIANLYDPEQLFEFDFDDDNELFTLKVHVLYGYDLYFRASRLVYEQDIDGLEVQ